MIKIPKEVQFILGELAKHNFEGYAVGGCARDFLLNKEPNDWDITTNARPEEIQKIFPESIYENRFGTVMVKSWNLELGTWNIIEVTTYRVDEKYTNKRHPDKIKFTSSLEEDLARRDFTVNAMALKNQESRIKNQEYEIIDLFKGREDLKNKLIRAVGNPEKRFNEDALRMLRAVRLAVNLNFTIEKNTFKAIQKNSPLLKFVSQERIRDELIKIILSDQPDEGIELLREAKLLRFILPELEKGIGVAQNLHHIHTIYQHLILSLKHCPSKKLETRLAALFHDIAKPQVKKGEGPTSTFYNHDLVGARITRKIMRRLRFSNSIIDKTTLLVKNHMFYFDVEIVSEAGVRRLLKRVGRENMKDLMDLRIADRLGSGVPKAKPYKLRYLEYLVHKVSKDPISVKTLKIDGGEVMKILNIKPGPEVGAILNVLLAEVLEDPEKNDKKYLTKKIKELKNLDLKEIKKCERKIKERKEEEDLKDKQKFWVK
jgi:putative nucleotidyltransferase with HDIG domain